MTTTMLRSPITLIDEVVGEIEGYIAIWGSPEERDSYGTWFDRDMPPDLALDFLPFPMAYEHGQDSRIRKTIIGSVEQIWFDDVGIAFRGLLNRGAQHFPKLVNDIIHRKLFTSSSTAGHIADFDEDGRFVTWYLVELSLTETPAESRIPYVTLTRSKGGQHNLILTTNHNPEGGRDAPGDSDGQRTFSMTRGATMPVLDDLLAPEAQDTPLDTLLSAIIEEYGEQAVVDLLAQQSPPDDEIETMLADLDPEEVETVDEMVEEVVDAVIEEITQEENLDLEDALETAVGEVLEEVLEDDLPGDWDEETLSRAVTARARTGIAKRLIGSVKRTTKRNKRSKRSNKPQRQGRHVGNGTAAIARLEKRIEQMLRSRQAAPPGTPPSNPRRPSGGQQMRNQPRISVSSKYDRLSADELALGYIMLRSANKHRAPDEVVGEEYMRAMAYKTAHLIDKGDKAATDFAVIRSFPFRGDGRNTRAAEVMQSRPDFMNIAVRAGEVMNGGATQGAEWIHELQGTTLWEFIRAETPLYAQFLSMGMDEQELPQGFDSETIPLEGSDPTWYVAAGAADVDASSGMPTPTYATSKFGTGERIVNVAKLSTAMTFQRELEEDSIIAIVPEANRKIRVSATEQIEYIFGSGDTALTANTNINLIDGTPPGAPTRPSYTLLNGFLKLALVTNASNSRECNATLSDVDFMATLGLMPGRMRQNRRKLLFVIDSETALAVLNIPTLKTRDVFSAPTLEEGILMEIIKIKVMESGQMPAANAAGFVSGTPANNTRGRIALTRPDQWASRWKRRIQTDVTYYSYSDTTMVTAHMRWGVAYRDNEAAAVTYNVPLTLE